MKDEKKKCGRKNETKMQEEKVRDGSKGRK